MSMLTRSTPNTIIGIEKTSSGTVCDQITLEFHEFHVGDSIDLVTVSFDS